MCVSGPRPALHPIQAPDRPVPAAVPPHSAPTPATRPNAAPSAAATLGT